MSPPGSRPGGRPRLLQLFFDPAAKRLDILLLRIEAQGCGQGVEGLGLPARLAKEICPPFPSINPRWTADRPLATGGMEWRAREDQNLRPADYEGTDLALQVTDK